MSAIVILDTSVFLNVLDVPGRNQDRTAVIRRLREFHGARAQLLLPLAAVIETGNHIARLPNGGQRRRFANRFAVEVRKAIVGEAPWRAMVPPEEDEILTWLERFPDRASEGIGMADLSIVEAWELERARHPRRRVLVWSLDGHLRGYDSGPS